MIVATHLVLTAALMGQSVPSGFHLVGRPTTFDYWKPSPSAWVEAVVQHVDKRGGTLSVRASASRVIELTFVVEDRADIAEHRIGDAIRIEVSTIGGQIRVRHVDD